MNTPTTPNREVQPLYMVDNQQNLHIQAGDTRLTLSSAAGLELIKFLERCQFQQNANATKGAAQ